MTAIAKAWPLGALAVAALALSAVGSVSEGQSALVIRLGAPLAVISEPGLYLTVPLVDTVTVYETRLLSLDPPAEQIILGDQKRIEVQAYTRYRISGPLRFYQSVRTVPQAEAQLAQIVSSSLRRELGRIKISDLLSETRDSILANIQAEVTARAAPMGISIVGVRLHRADLPAETSQAIYDRMKSERQREAKELRAQGFEWAQQIQAKADRERTVLLSEAQRDASILRGEGDAGASKLLGEAESVDPGFYRFYRTLQTYRQTLAGAAPTLVLSPDAGFLGLMKAGPDGAVSGTAPAAAAEAGPPVAPARAAGD